MEEITLETLIESIDYKRAVKLIKENKHKDELIKILICIHSCKFEPDKLLLYKERLEKELKFIKKEFKDEN